MLAMTKQIIRAPETSTRIFSSVATFSQIVGTICTKMLRRVTDSVQNSKARRRYQAGQITLVQ